MKYKVKTDLFPHCCEGDVIKVENGNVKHPSGYGNLKGLTPEILEKNEQWFEPVPEVEAGQYWEWHDSDCESCIFRIQAVHSETEGARIKYLNDVEKDWYWADITEDATPLSDDQVEQALIEEAKRRGFAKSKRYRDVEYSGNIWSGGYGKGFVYDPKTDTLYLNCGRVYKQGQWAEIIEEWEVKPIPNTRFFSIIKNEDCKITSVGKCGLDKKQAEAIKEALNDLV